MDIISLLFTYIQANEDHIRDISPCLLSICLPGMTEAYKLQIFLHIDEETSLRTVFVCDPQAFEKESTESAAFLEMHRFTERYLDEFKAQGICEAIDVCETDMFSKINMGEVLNVIICNAMLEQFTTYNLPIIYPEELQPVHIHAIQKYEQLYHRYLSSSNKKGELMLKMVYPLETYALLAIGNQKIYHIKWKH